MVHETLHPRENIDYMFQEKKEEDRQGHSKITWKKSKVTRNKNEQHKDQQNNSNLKKNEWDEKNKLYGYFGWHTQENLDMAKKGKPRERETECLLIAPQNNAERRNLV